MGQDAGGSAKEVLLAGQVGHAAGVPQLLGDLRQAVRRGRYGQAAELIDAGVLDKVWDQFRRDPSLEPVVLELAEILSQIGREADAEEYYRRLLDTGAGGAVAYNKLGCLCQRMARMAEALEYQRKAVDAQPDRPELWANLARVLIETGDIEQGMALLEKAIDRMPQNWQARSNYLFRLHYLPELDPGKLLREHRRWGQLYAPPGLARTVHQNDPDPDRRLRVGYVSADFRRHSVAYFFESLLDGHDRQDVEVFGYGNVEFRDEVTARLEEKFDHFRDIRHLSDDAAAELIEQDRIDILVDLTGHAGGSRLLVFARKPAPIQVTYLGYPNTTGVEAVDYRLTDALAEAGQAGSDRAYTEELVYLPDGFLCYRPPDFAPCVGPLPADRNDYVTFGSFNNNCKITQTVISLWSDVLRATENSRLLLKLRGGQEPLIRDRYRERFERAGVPRERVEICGWKDPIEHLQTYGRVDIALDTYPYNGTTTTCEALWMGVPIVSLVGKCHVSRVGLSILTRLGLGFFAASTQKEYVAKATALAANLPALAQIRRSMRARMARSGFCHAKSFASRFEAAYRQMWHRWCRTARL